MSAPKIGSWVVRKSSISYIIKNKKYRIIGIDNHDIISLLTLSIFYRTQIENYRFIQVIDQNSGDVSYATPFIIYTYKNGSVSSVDFDVRDYDITKWGPLINMLHLSWKKFVKDRFNLSLDDEIMSSKKLLDLMHELYIKSLN